MLVLAVRIAVGMMTVVRMGATSPSLVVMVKMTMSVMPMIVMVVATKVWAPTWRCKERLRKMKKTMMFRT